MPTAPSFLNGLGFSVGTFDGGAQMAQSTQNMSQGTGVGGQFSVSAGVGGANSGQLGAGALLLILGGLVVLYVSTRSIQGGR